MHDRTNVFGHLNFFRISFLFLTILSFLYIFSTVHAATGVIDTSATNTALVCHDVTCTTPTPGNINFELTNESSIVIDSDTGITGRVWGNELGWIIMNPTGSGVTFANATTGVLTGFAWSQVSGWINFAPTGEQVKINPSNGEFEGWAWSGGPYGGWIKFDCDDGACVTTTWRATSSSSGSSGSIPDAPPTVPIVPPVLPVTPVVPTYPGIPVVDDSPSGEGSDPTSGDDSGVAGDGGSTLDDNTDNSGGGGQNVPSETKPKPTDNTRTPNESITSDFYDGFKSNLKVILDEPTISNLGKFAIALPLLTSAALAVNLIGAGVPLVNFLSYLFFIIPQFLRFKRKPKPWGNIYDSVTKRPVPFAKVDILDINYRKLESTIADQNGRYGFLITDEFIKNGNTKFMLEVRQDNYSFPSNGEVSPNEKILYPNIYQSGFVTADSERRLVNFDIPVTPKTQSNYAAPYFKLFSVSVNNFWLKVINILFVTGIVFGIANYVKDPRAINLIPIGLVLITGFLRFSGFALKPYGIILDSQTSKPMPFGFVALHSNTGERVYFTVSDENGRYFILSPRGSFLLKSYTPAHIVPMRQRETMVNARSGWIDKEIML